MWPLRGLLHDNRVWWTWSLCPAPLEKQRNMTLLAVDYGKAIAAALSYVFTSREQWGCMLTLEKAIGQNQSLTTLLDQARTEHPLPNQQNLEGTPWDPQYRPPE